MELNNIIILSFLIILIAFLINISHLLISLLYLEGIMLSIVLYIPTTLNISPNHQLALILLTFSACEASLGLRIIVKLSRSYGSDLLSSSSINSC